MVDGVKMVSRRGEGKGRLLFMVGCGGLYDYE